MSANSDGPGGRNKTVFRPSPLQGLKQGAPAQPAQPAQPQGWGTPPPAYPPDGNGHGGNGGPSPYGAPPAYAPPPSPYQQEFAPPAAPQSYDPPPVMSRAGPVPGGPPLAPSRLGEDDVPQPSTPREVRNIMLAEAGPVLALAAGVRSGRVRLPLPQLHRQATEAIASFDRTIGSHYPQETRQRAKYALCATIDDIAQNLPGIGHDGAEWARRSLVVSFFQENIGGDRFWQLVDDMIRSPAENRDLIELFHACLAAGFEGRFRVMPDGQRRLHEIMSRLNGALEHVRSLSAVEISPMWRGEKAPLSKVGFWTYVAMAAAAAAAVLFVAYIGFRLILMSTGEAPSDALATMIPDERLRMSREGQAMPAGDSEQAGRLKQFLQPEIEQGLVTVEEDGQTVRVRTTVGQLFKSGDDQLEAGREALFRRIGQAIETEPGPVMIEGHADSDQPNGVRFPDNMTLSSARADTVAGIIRGTLSDGSRVESKGFGDAQPIASNDTAAGKSENRRVEIVVQRRY